MRLAQPLHGQLDKVFVSGKVEPALEEGGQVGQRPLAVAVAPDQGARGIEQVRLCPHLIVDHELVAHLLDQELVVSGHWFHRRRRLPPADAGRTAMASGHAYRDRPGART